MNKKLLMLGAFAMILVLSGIFVSAVTETKNLDCGNNVCEKYTHVFKNGGEKDSITLEGKPVAIEFISGVAGDDNNNIWNINGIRGSMSEISNSYLNPINNNFNFFINIGDYSKYNVYDYLGKEVYIKEEQYCQLDCINDAQTDNNIREISLLPGWNLISLEMVDFQDCNLVPENTVCQDDVLVEFAYIPLLKKYINSNTFNKGEGSSQSEIEAVQKAVNKLTSRFVYLKDSVTNKRFAMTLFESQVLTPVNLSSGWNFLSITPQMAGKSLNQIKGNCNIEKIATFENQKWTFVSSAEVLGADDTGIGFIIKVSSDCVFGGTSSTSGVSPPSLP